MLKYTSSSNFIHVHFIIMEMLDRTWTESATFRNEYFAEENQAYDAIIERGTLTQIYCVVPTIALYRLSEKDDS